VGLAGAHKSAGIFPLQTKRDGPVRLIVAEVSTEGAVRGYAQYDAERLASAGAAATDAFRARGSSPPSITAVMCGSRPGRRWQAC